MSVYSINRSEPLVTGFEIPAGGLDGPGGASANTSLRLYGKGALQWGESVNEDLVRLAENFASASPPPNPISGQLWVETTYYVKFGTSWYVYNFATSSPQWTDITSNVTSTTGMPTTPPIKGVGSHSFDSTAGILWGYFPVQGSVVNSSGSASWVARSFLQSSQDPNVAPVAQPQQTVRVYNSYVGTWISISTTASETAPSSPVDGTLWYDVSTDTLKVWSNGSWNTLLVGTTSGDLDLQNTYRIINMPLPSSVTDGASKDYVDTAITTALGSVPGSGTFLELTGGTLTGPGDLVINGTLSVVGATTLSTVRMGGKITNLTAGTVGTDAVNKSQMDTAIASAVSSISNTETVYAISSTSGAISIDVSQGTLQTITLTGNTTLSVVGLAPGNAVNSVTLVITASTGLTLTWPLGTKWMNGTIPPLTGGGATDIFTMFSYDGGTTWIAAVVAQAVA